MTAINVLLINYDDGALNTYTPLLAKHGITPRSVSTMCEALDMLLNDQYSGIVINADNFEYLPYLKVMRALTPVPIGVAVSSYSKIEHDEARKKGADLYRVRYDDPAHRVANVSGQKECQKSS